MPFVLGRRRFISLVGAAPIVGAASAGVYAQGGRVYRIGILETIPADRNHANLDALLRGLRDRGYVEGQNLRVEYRSADGRAERFLDLATELVHLPVDLTVTPVSTPVWDQEPYARPSPGRLTPRD